MQRYVRATRTLVRALRTDPHTEWEIDRKTFPRHIINALGLNALWTETDPLTHSEYLRLLPASELLKADPYDLFIWCHANARYFVPTLEIVTWLKDYIGNRRTIEICAGMGDLGRHLGIKSTDSRIQIRDTELAEYYRSHNVFPTVPPNSVMTMEALEAVQRLRPSVVIAAWATQKFKPGDTAEANSFAYGVDEEKLIRKIDTYIFIGTTRIHGNKRIMRFPHETHKINGHVSRAKDRDSNVIYVWHRNQL